jgi:hypothetical protein
MSTPVQIKDGSGSGADAKVTKVGELVVGAYAHDEVVTVTLDVATQGYGFYSPKAGMRFIITGLLVAGNLSISANALATVTVYEAENFDTATEGKLLLQFGITRLQTFPIMPLNISVAEGKFINAKTDDDDVFLTIMGYFIPVLEQ